MECPVDYTCPDIDYTVRIISNVVSLLDTFSRDCEYSGNPIQTHNIDYSIQLLNSLYAIDGPIEDIREANTKLREWGYDMDRARKYAEIEIVSQSETIQELRNTIRELEDNAR